MPGEDSNTGREAPEFLADQGGTDRKPEDGQGAVDPNAKRDEANNAESEAAKIRNEADAKRREIAENKKSDEQREAEKFDREADLKMLEGETARQEAASAEVARTVGEAGVITRLPPETPLHLHSALKRGNDPANPAPYKAEHEDEDERTERLLMTTPDGERECFVHPDMVSDSLRAGWRRP